MNKCKYTEEYDEKTGSIFITNEYDCEWCDGVGTRADGEFCGECDFICEKECPARKRKMD